MKTGIVTFHFPFNAGAALQCYALSKTLESLGSEVKVIDYTPWYHWNRYAARKNPVYYAKKKLHDPARNIVTRTYHGVKGFYDTVRSWKSGRVRIEREQKYAAFRKAYLHETRTYRTIGQLRTNPPKCDLYLAGSDQLWNTKLTDGKLDPAYALDFGPEGTRRATYAVGCYFSDPAAAQKTLEPLMHRLDAVSLRETRFLRPVMGAAGDRPVHIDVDPTLLLDAGAYEALLPKEPLCTEPFVVIYTMPGPAQKQVNEAAKLLEAKTGLHLIDVNGNPNAENCRIKDHRVCSPQEFLWYISHAEYVLTNSFHGTVFSVLFHKRFATILHKETGNRVSELLDKLGLTERYTNETAPAVDIVGRPVDWDRADAARKALAEESVRYLRYCLGQKATPSFATEKDIPVEVKANAQAGAAQEQKPVEPPVPVRAQIAEAHRLKILYPDDKNAQVVLALLKKYNIRRIVVSPGTTNVPIARTVQFDPFFEVYSAVDERGAAYLAGGLAFATGEPVAISCTGATASRDYIPGLTEAYYRGLPVIAITSQHHSPMYSDLMPQVTDRTVSQNDIKRFAAILPVIKDDEDLRACVQLVNEALYTATRRDAGPVHINLPVTNMYSFTTPALPDVQKIDVYDAEAFPTDALKAALKGKNVALFIGAHKPFDAATKAAIETFAANLHAPVFCDQTANYAGRNRVLSAVAGDLSDIKTLPDLVIDLGSVSGDYSASRFFKGRRVWRISEDRRFHNRHGAEIVEKLFFCSERFFFEHLKTAVGENTYYETVAAALAPAKTPTLPLSNIYAASMLSARIPKDSFLHLGILNSLRSMNFFALDPSVRVSCNVGGFGIDGALSTALGQALADKNRMSFCLLGDLAFFYDMNALGNRHVGRNLRILLINNGRGVEFRLNAGLERLWGSDTDDLIAAKGHFGSAKGWAESMGFRYLCAADKAAFEEQIDAFCDPDAFDRPVVFEVFTDAENEKTALAHLRAFNHPLR